MSKYKLIKDYPTNHLPIGTVVHTDKYGQIVTENGEIIAYREDEIKQYPEFWEEIKEPLFRTKDGIDIYEGDKYWEVRGHDNYYISSYKAGEMPNHYERSKITFFDKKKAHDWIDRNEKKYSKDDIENAIVKLDVEPKQSVHIYFDKFWEELENE